MLNETIRNEATLEPVSLTDAFDPFYNDCRHTESLPSWLQLQQDIRTQLNRLLAHAQTLAESDLQQLNRSIDAYNACVPNMHMRKPQLTLTDLDDALESWQ
ncbi:hypothetical protein [Paenibacillus sp. HJGM_3]|uniref:hypothetical protein n=1 Tax=Paenibacillus sp. HJGM_3 TaxID=3379816 RepID=UPI003858F189